MRWNTVVTDVGLNLLSNVTDSQAINIVRAACGVGTSEDLSSMTELTSEVMDLSIASSEQVSTTDYAVKLVLSNEDVEESFNLTQIGIFATLGSGTTEYLFMVMQVNDTGDVIPDSSISKSFTANYVVTLSFSNSTNVTIVVDDTGVETMIDEAVAECKAYTDEQISGIVVGDDYLPLAGGTMTGDIDLNGNNITSKSALGVSAANDLVLQGKDNVVIAGDVYGTTESHITDCVWDNDNTWTISDSGAADFVSVEANTVTAESAEIVSAEITEVVSEKVTVSDGSGSFVVEMNKSSQPTITTTESLHINSTDTSFDSPVEINSTIQLASDPTSNMQAATKRYVDNLITADSNSLYLGGLLIQWGTYTANSDSSVYSASFPVSYDSADDITNVQLTLAGCGTTDYSFGVEDFPISGISASALTISGTAYNTGTKIDGNTGVRSGSEVLHWLVVGNAPASA